MMIPSIELAGLADEINTVRQYADLDSDEFNEAIGEATVALDEAILMLEDNGE